MENLWVPTLVQGTAIAGAMVAAAIIGHRSPHELRRLGSLGRLAAVGLLVIGVALVHELAWTLVGFGTVLNREVPDRTTHVAQGAAWIGVLTVWIASHLVAGGYLLRRRRWALVLGVGLCAIGLGLGVAASVHTLALRMSLGAGDTVPLAWSLLGLGRAAPYLVVGALLTWHDRDPLATTAEPRPAPRPSREHGASSAALLAGAVFSALAWAMFQLMAEPFPSPGAGIEHLIGAGVAVPTAGWLGHRYAGHALDGIAARSLALRLAIIGAVAGSAVTVTLAAVYRAFVLYPHTAPVWSITGIPMGIVQAVPGVALGAFVTSLAWIWFMRSGVLRPPAEEPAL